MAHEVKGLAYKTYKQLAKQYHPDKGGNEC